MNPDRPVEAPIVHVVSSGGLYGIERMLLNLLPRLQRIGHHVSLLCLDGPETEISRAAQTAGIPTSSVDCARTITPGGWWQLLRMLSPNRFRAVHVHGYKATILAGAAGQIRGIPVVGTYHGLAGKASELAPSMGRYLAIESPIMRGFHTVAAVSEEIAVELTKRGVCGRRVVVIPNGIEDPLMSPQARAPSATGRGTEESKPAFSPSILCVNRLVPDKNMHLVLGAVASLRTEFPDIGLIVAGDGFLRDALESQAEALGIMDAIHFLGFVSDVDTLFRQADCFILASQTEGMPMSLLEAMAHSVPIIASRIGGIPSMLSDGVEGLLIEPNDLDSLARSLRTVLSDAQFRSQLGTAARDRFKRDFTATKMAEAYAAVYDEIARA